MKKSTFCRLFSFWFVFGSLPLTPKSWIPLVQSPPQSTLKRWSSPSEDGGHLPLRENLRSLWKSKPHKIASSHVHRIISCVNNEFEGCPPFGKTILSPIGDKSNQNYPSVFRRFYEGNLPTGTGPPPDAAPQKGKVLSYRLDIAYDGAQFAGWQRQTNSTLPTVQEVVESSICQLTGENAVNVRVAGRTDAGVHAISQVARVRLPRNATNFNVLPSNSSAWCCWSLTPVSKRFHPTFGSKSRSYVYLLDASSLHSFLQKDGDDEEIVPRKVLIDLIARLNKMFIPLIKEEFDYIACSYGRVTTETTLCRIDHLQARLLRILGEEEHLKIAPQYAVAIEITGNRFLRRMVRILVATSLELALVPIGGTLDRSDQRLFGLICNKNRRAAALPAAPGGLVFVGADVHVEL